MLPPSHRTPSPVLRKVLGWVLVAPLLLSFLRLPFPLGLVLVLASITASVYGARFAQLHASRRVTVCAVIITLLNIAAFFVIGTASVLKALYWFSWLYWYPYYADWVYWNF